ncbi:protein of unknown function [Hyphomicrobium sp. MC1]|nr:protein of unknown function [Hyphomicrobium sp. MC1]
MRLRHPFHGGTAYPELCTGAAEGVNRLGLGEGSSKSLTGEKGQFHPPSTVLVARGRAPFHLISTTTRVRTVPSMMALAAGITWSSEIVRVIVASLSRSRSWASNSQI